MVVEWSKRTAITNIAAAFMVKMRFGVLSFVLESAGSPWYYLRDSPCHVDSFTRDYAALPRTARRPLYSIVYFRVFINLSSMPNASRVINGSPREKRAITITHNNNFKNNITIIIIRTQNDRTARRCCNNIAVDQTHRTYTRAPPSDNNIGK